MNLRPNRSHSISIHQASWATILALPLFSLGGCQDMKNAMQSGFSQANATANAEADRQAAYARGEDPDQANHSPVGGNENAASASIDSGSESANPSGPVAADSGAADRSNNTAPSDSRPDTQGSYDDPESSPEEDAWVVDEGASGGSSGHGGNPNASAAPTVSNRKEDVETGTERWGWTDAKVGWYVRYKVQGGMEMSQEVVDVTDDLLLMEMKTIMPGMDMPASRTWQARLMVKYEGDATTDCESETKDLADETLSIDGQSVTCKVSEATTVCPGMTTQSKSWMTDEVPGELVKSMTDGQVAMELVEYRK